MKYYLVYLLNYKDNDAVILKDSYVGKEDAMKSLERHAVEYIKELQGKQQADICKQEKTSQEILLDINLKEGMYYRNEDSVIILYEKCVIIEPGTVWGVKKNKIIKKIGKFYITEYNFDDSIFRCTCMLEKRDTAPKFKRPEITLSFIDELKQLSEKNEGKIKLKPLKDRVTGEKPKVVGEEKQSFVELCHEITNF